MADYFWWYNLSPRKLLDRGGIEVVINVGLTLLTGVTGKIPSTHLSVSCIPVRESRYSLAFYAVLAPFIGNLLSYMYFEIFYIHVLRMSGLASYW